MNIGSHFVDTDRYGGKESKDSWFEKIKNHFIADNPKQFIEVYCSGLEFYRQPTRHNKK